MKKKKFLWIIAMFFQLAVFSQEETAFSFFFDEEPLDKVLAIIEDTFEVRFSYPDAAVQGKVFSLAEDVRTLKQLTHTLGSSSGLTFEFIDERYIVVYGDDSTLDAIQLLRDVIVTGYLASGITKAKDGVFRIESTKQSLLPGLIEPDILESLQQLPGVTSPNETATGFTIRGGGTDQNRIIWDGINIYHKGHLFGMISPFNPNSIHKVTFSTKGTHSRYGERVSGVVDIESQKEITNALGGTIGLNGLSADAFLEVPLIDDKLSVQASVRRSYKEVFITPTFEKLANKIFQSTKINEVESSNNDFYFLDYTARMNYKLNNDNLFSVSIISIDNSLNFLVTDSDTEVLRRDVLDINNEGYGISWRGNLSNTIQHITQAYFSKYKLHYNFIESENEVLTSDFKKRNEIWDSGVSSEVQIRTKNDNLISFGYQYALKDVSYAFLEEADFSFVLDSDRAIQKTHGLYAQYGFRNPRLFDIDGGLRASYFQELDEVKFEPRLVVSKDIFSNVKLQLSGELKNQAISEIDETILSDLSLENKLWRLADGETFPIINSKHASIGFVYNNGGLTVDIDSYIKKITGTTALSLGFLNPLDSQFHIGEQEIIGMNLYAKKDLDSFKTWISYSFGEVKSKYDDLNNGEFFVANTNIKHTFRASLAYSIEDFQLSIAWNWRSGKPYTKSFINPLDDLLYFESINTERLPDYHRMDLSSTYNFSFSKKNRMKGKVGISIRNVYNKKNHLSREYTGNNNFNNPITVVDKFSLGFTPNFLLRAYW